MSEDLSTRLSRWSQRKLAARRGAAAEDIAREEDKPAAPAGPSANAAPPAEEEAPVLPSIEELTGDSDYTVFLAKKVPEAIKNAALRKLWRSDPVFANLDGLNDYCEDLNATYEPITLAQTAYKVGKGYFDDAVEMLEKMTPAADETAARDESLADGAAGQPGDNAPDLRKNIASAEDNHTPATRQVGEAAAGVPASGQRPKRD